MARMISMAIWTTTMATQITMVGVGRVGTVGRGQVRGAARHSGGAGLIDPRPTSCRVLFFEH